MKSSDPELKSCSVHQLDLFISVTALVRTKLVYLLPFGIINVFSLSCFCLIVVLKSPRGNVHLNTHHYNESY